MGPGHELQDTAIQPSRVRPRRLSVARGTVSTASGLVLSNATGLARQLVFAWIYGAGRQMDAFLIAGIVSQIVFASVDSALSATLIPIYSKLRAESEDEARRFLAATSSLVTVFTGLVGVLLYFVAPILVHLLAPGFVPSEVRLASTMLRVMMPSVVFMGLSSVSVGFLQTRGRFGDPAVMYIPRNIVLIVGAALLGRRFGIDVLAWGTVIGSVLQLATVLRPALRLGISRRFVWQPRHAGIRTMLGRLPAVFTNFFMYQAALIVDRILASGLPGGMISSLNYAQILLQPPLGIIGSLAVAAFPALSDMAAEKRFVELSRAVRLTLRLTAFFSVPISAFAMFYRTPVVALLYAHGSFGQTALLRTADSLAFFSVGFVSMALNAVLGRTMFALGETRALMTSAAAAVGVTIVADLLLIHWLLQGGLALGTSLGSWISTLVLLRLVGQRVDSFRRKPVLASLLGSIMTAMAAYGLVALAVAHWFPSPVTGGFGVRLEVLLVGAVLGTALYLGLHAPFAGGRTQLREMFNLGKQALGKAAG